MTDSRRLLIVLLVTFIVTPILATVDAHADGRVRLYICYDFSPSPDQDGSSTFTQIDREILKGVLDSIPCWQNFVDVVFVPSDDQYCEECRIASADFGVRCECLMAEERAGLELEQQTYYSLLDSLGNLVSLPIEAKGRIRFLPRELLLPTGRVALNLVGLPPNTSVRLANTACSEISYYLADPQFIRDVPIGNYELRAPGFPTQVFHVDKGSYVARTVDLSPDQKYAERKPLRPTRTTLGFNMGVQVIPFEAPHDFWQGVATFGMSTHINGIVGIEIGAYLADSLRSFEGGKAAIVLTPEFLTSGDALSLSPKAGVVWIRPKAVGPKELRGDVEFKRGFYGAELFLGTLGTRHPSAGHRFGIVAEAVYSEPKEYRLPYWPHHVYKIGGWFGGLGIQAEF